MNEENFKPSQRDLAEILSEFLRDYYREDIAAMSTSDDTSLIVDLQDLWRFDPDLFDDVVEKAQSVPEKLWMLAADYVDLPVEGIGIEHVRFKDADREARGVMEWSTDDIGTQRITIEGQIDQVSQEKAVTTEVAFECQQCGTITDCVQNPGDDETTEPHECKACERKGPFKPDMSRTTSEYRQQLRLQTPPEESDEGTREIVVSIQGDVAGEYLSNAGNRARVTGIPRGTLDDDGTIDQWVDASFIEIVDSTGTVLDPSEHQDALQQIRESENPIGLLEQQILPGFSKDKQLARICANALLCIVGGNLEDGRDNPHMQLIGDPGGGKSDILKAIRSLAPRSVKAAEQSSGVGLTASVIRDDFGPGEWSIRPGSIVRAHGGVLTIDEMDKIDESDVEKLHTVLQSGEVSVSKAAAAELPAQATVISAANPIHGKFDKYEPLGQQLGFSATLLSRFDTVWGIRDQVDEDRDEDIFNKIFDSQNGGEGAEPDIDHDAISCYLDEVSDLEPTIPESLMQKASDAAKNLRQATYSDDGDTSAPSETIRVANKIQRLSTAAAKLHERETVKEKDIDIAAELIEKSHKSLSTISEGSDIGVLENGESYMRSRLSGQVTRFIEERYQEIDGIDGPTRADILNQFMDEHDGDEVDRVIDSLKKNGDISKINDGFEVINRR